MKFQIKGIDSFKSGSGKSDCEKSAYHQYDSGYFFNCLLEYASFTDTTSVNAYAKSKEGIFKSSFLHYYHKSGLSDYKKVVHLTLKLQNSSLQNILRRQMTTQKPKFFLPTIAVAIWVQMKSSC